MITVMHLSLPHITYTHRPDMAMHPCLTCMEDVGVNIYGLSSQHLKLPPAVPPPLQAAKDVAETMSKSKNVVYLPSTGNMLLGINPN